MTSHSTYTRNFPFKIEPKVLESDRLLLEPLSEGHVEELVSLFDPIIWQWYTHRILDPSSLRNFLKNIINEQNQNKTLAFAIREKDEKSLVGSSRFLNLHPSHRRVEIGSTWYACKWQRTFVNTESKLSMLSYAFEELSCISVQLQTDVLNKKSRTAIERLGAKLDGVLRNDRIREDGRIRDSAYYSITSAEWPDLKNRLAKKLAGT